MLPPHTTKRCRKARLHNSSIRCFVGITRPQKRTLLGRRCKSGGVLPIFHLSGGTPADLGGLQLLPHALSPPVLCKKVPPVLEARLSLRYAHRSAPEEPSPRCCRLPAAPARRNTSRSRRLHRDPPLPALLLPRLAGAEPSVLLPLLPNARAKPSTGAVPGSFSTEVLAPLLPQNALLSTRGDPQGCSGHPAIATSPPLFVSSPEESVGAVVVHLGLGAAAGAGAVGLLLQGGLAQRPAGASALAAPHGGHGRACPPRVRAEAALGRGKGRGKGGARPRRGARGRAQAHSGEGGGNGGRGEAPVVMAA